MTKNGIDVSKTISEVERLLEESKDLPPALEASINMLLVVVKLLADSHGLNSRNSSKPPSTDPHREKKAPNSNKKSQGGQKGHAGNNLKFVDDPDEVEIIEIDRRSLPVGEYHECGFQSRQVFDIRINRHVIEYRAQILEDSNG